MMDQRSGGQGLLNLGDRHWVSGLEGQGRRRGKEGDGDVYVRVLMVVA